MTFAFLVMAASGVDLIAVCVIKNTETACIRVNMCRREEERDRYIFEKSRSPYSGSIHSIPWYCDDLEITSHPHLPQFTRFIANEKYRKSKNLCPFLFSIKVSYLLTHRIYLTNRLNITIHPSRYRLL